MSIIKNIFQNFRKPKNSFMGRCIVKMMNQGHNRISLWCIDNFVKLSGGETVLDIGCGGGQNVANFIKRTHGLVCGMDYCRRVLPIQEMGKKIHNMAMDRICHSPTRYGRHIYLD